MWNRTVRPDIAASCADARSRVPGLPSARPSSSAIWSEPITKARGWQVATASAFSSARRSAVAEGLSSLQARSSISGGTTRKGRPSRARSARR